MRDEKKIKNEYADYIDEFGERYESTEVVLAMLDMNGFPNRGGLPFSDPKKGRVDVDRLCQIYEDRCNF